MKFYKYIVLLSVLALALACAKEEFRQFPNEVQFGLSLDNANGTRTIYGPASDTGYPIYWSDGDTVLVASPQCAVKSAKYKVTPKTGQNYAEAMTKTGVAGVQWGTDYAKFYSIYPSAKASWDALSVDDVVANLNISSTQSANLVLDETAHVYSSADMKNVIMYARTGMIEPGTTVDLKYIPYSTILEFEVELAQGKDSQQNLLPWGTAKVMSMTLTAPEDTPLAGNFSFKFDGTNQVVTATGNNTNVIEMTFKTQPVLNQNNPKLFAKFALIPSADIDITKGVWTIGVEILNGTDKETVLLTKSLTIKDSLVPGKVHRIKLPKISSTGTWVPNMKKWITQLYDYKNIYLTELSLPGAWYAAGKIYSGNDAYKNYQSTNVIDTLWNHGVRAFAVECKSTTSGMFNSTPSSVAVSGTASGCLTNDGQYGGTKIRTVISNIAKAITADQFAVLVLSYADGGGDAQRETDHNYFINGIKNEIANSGATNIYKKEVTPSTTVNEVLGQLIIKVNVDKNLSKSSYDDSMNAMLSYTPFVSQVPVDSLATPLFSKMYWSEWKDDYERLISYNTNDFLWCFTSANRTQVDSGTDTSLPTYAQRKTTLRSMMAHSKELSESSNHNIWFYFNAGGTQATSNADTDTKATNFASEMNSWLLKLIRLKSYGGTDNDGVMGTAGAYIQSDPSPLGIIMFNHCTNSDYKGPDIVKEIVEMNNRSTLRRAPAVDGGGSGEGGLDQNSVN